MIILLKIILTLLGSILSATLGRMGGAEGYNTLYRDIGCSLISVLLFILWFGFKPNYWYLYIISFGLHWGAFSTYYDKLFGFDNLWFSGFMTGLALLPLLFIEKTLLFFLIIRALVLAVLWGVFNKCLPAYVWKFRHDVAEELLRYGVVVLTYLGRIIK